jgi:hypothetical protein
MSLYWEFNYTRWICVCQLKAFWHRADTIKIDKYNKNIVRWYWISIYWWHSMGYATFLNGGLYVLNCLVWLISNSTINLNYYYYCSKKKQPEVMEKRNGTEVIQFRFVDNYLHFIFYGVVTFVCKELIFSARQIAF